MGEQYNACDLMSDMYNLDVDIVPLNARPLRVLYALFKMCLDCR